MKKAVIIGAGIAGITAAAELRKLYPGTDLNITIVSAENPPDYSRIRLPEFVAGTLAEEALVLHRHDWFRRQNITVLPETQASDLHCQRKTLSVRSAQGTNETLSYDVLIIASGARAFAPCRPSPESPAFGSVFTLRTIADARALKKRIETHRNAAAVIGGGLLGIEAARALKTAGVNGVHIVETAPYLLPRQLDRTASALLTEYLTAEGLTVHTGVSLDLALLETRTPQELLAPLSAGNDPAETVVLSMGVRSETELAQTAGIACGKGITVNASMRTSEPAVFAAGDCAEFEGVVWGIVPAALEQAKTAAQNAAHYLYPESVPQPEPYRQTVPRTTLSIGNKETVSAGKAVLTDQEVQSGNWKEHVLSESPYVRIVEDTQTGTVAGALAFGDSGTGRTFLMPLQKAVGNSVQAAKELITELQFHRG